MAPGLDTRRVTVLMPRPCPIATTAPALPKTLACTDGETLPILAVWRRAAKPVDVIQAEAPQALSFLAEDWGFTGPELTVEGVVCRSSGMNLYMGFWSRNHERGFTTTLALVGGDGTERRALLGVLYTASGLGSASDVPETAGTLNVTRKRIGQHANALRRLMPHLDAADSDALFTRCSRGIVSRGK